MAEQDGLITNWYKSSKIDYLSSFMKLWVSFNSWYNLTLAHPPSDEKAIKKLKENQVLLDNFNEKFYTDSDEGKELRKALAVLIEETENAPILDRKGKEHKFWKSNITTQFKKSYQEKKEALEKNPEIVEKKVDMNEFAKENNAIVLDDYSNVIIVDNLTIVFKELLEVVYRVRCGIFHGSIDTEGIRTERLVKNAYSALSIIFRSEVKGV